MSINKGRSTFEYCWRFGVRPLMWLVRISLVFWAVASIVWFTDFLTVTGFALFIAVYGIWEVCRPIRDYRPMTIHVTRGETLVVEPGATVSVPKADLDRLLESIARQEAQKRAA